MSTTQGSTTTDNITTTLPGGTITSKTQTQVKHGEKSVFNASLDTPGVGVQTAKGTIIHTEHKTTTSETITTANGKAY